MKTRFLAVALAAGLATGAVNSANAGVFTIDFDTAATGSDIVSNPLVTPFGTVTASANGGTLSHSATPVGSGLTGGWLLHEQNFDDSSFAQLAFDFDVASISLQFTGFTAGVITIEALNFSQTVVDSFFDGDTNDDTPGGPIVLAGPGIRFLRFSDSPSNFNAAGLDDVELTVTMVPEPGALALFGLGLAGLGFAARRRRKTA